MACDFRLKLSLLQVAHGDLNFNKDKKWKELMAPFVQRVCPMNSKFGAIDTSYKYGDRDLKESSRSLEAHKAGLLFSELIRKIAASECLEWALEEASVDAIEGVFARIYFPKLGKFYLRGHVFINADEGYIHNHSAPFFSHCLQGGYQHKIWQVRDTRGKHYRRHRAKDNIIGAPEERQGTLRKRHEVSFKTKSFYFIGPSAYHTVHPHKNLPAEVEDNETGDGVDTDADDGREAVVVSTDTKEPGTQKANGLEENATGRGGGAKKLTSRWTARLPPRPQQISTKARFWRKF